MVKAGSVAIVTGGSRGIGREVCLLLAEAGYTVVVNYRANAKAANAVVAEIEQGRHRALAVQGDVSKEADVIKLFQQADALGPLTLLVNNAGIVDQAARVDEMSVERLERMMRTNIIGPFLCAREAIKRLSTKHGGQGGTIINMSSVSAQLGSPAEYVDYAASKGAIDTFTIGLAKEVAGENIRVAAIRPGLIETELHEPGRTARLREAVPLKRIGTPKEVAEAVLWLASPQASYVTAAILNVAGGRG